MAYVVITDAEITAEAPITQGLMFKLRDNPLALIGGIFTELTGDGIYQVPASVNKIRVICVGGGGGGGGGVSGVSAGIGGGVDA